MAQRNQPSVKRALDESLRGVDPHRHDKAALALAKRYAAQIDQDPECIGKIGPLLLDALRDLRMTPKARTSVVKGGTADDSGGQRAKFDELRNRRENRASSVDTSQA